MQSCVYGWQGIGFLDSTLPCSPALPAISWFESFSITIILWKHWRLPAWLHCQVWHQNKKSPGSLFTSHWSGPPPVPSFTLQRCSDLRPVWFASVLKELRNLKNPLVLNNCAFWVHHWYKHNATPSSLWTVFLLTMAVDLRSVRFWMLTEHQGSLEGGRTLLDVCCCF